MKKYFFLLLVTAIPINAFSQDLYQSMAEKACKCLDEKKLDYSTISNDKLKTEFGLCVIEDISKLDEATREKYNINFSDKQGMHKLGEQIALKMVSICPEVIIAIGKSAIDEKDEETIVVSDLIIDGKIIEIKEVQFLSLVIKDDKSRTHTFLVLDDFENAAMLTDNVLKKGDNVSVAYVEYEFFDPAIKEFRLFKVISGLTKK